MRKLETVVIGCGHVWACGGPLPFPEGGRERRVGGEGRGGEGVEGVEEKGDGVGEERVKVVGEREGEREEGERMPHCKLFKGRAKGGEVVEGEGREVVVFKITLPLGFQRDTPFPMTLQKLFQQAKQHPKVVRKNIKMNHTLRFACPQKSNRLSSTLWRGRRRRRRRRMVESSPLENRPSGSSG